MLTINGWTVLAHPLFLDRWEKLIEAVDALKAKKPEDYQKSADAKLLAALVQLVTVAIPSDPTAAAYRQGSTLGDDRKHWFRAKFGNGRFRLFFRYSSASKVIIFAWVNDENSLRTYGSKTDAYKIFKGMLDDGHPPDEWDALNKQASDPEAVDRLENASPSKS
jgi:toxin YhaV